MADLRVTNVPVGDLVPFERNAKLHTREQVDAVRQSIERFDFAAPVIAWHDPEGRARMHHEVKWRNAVPAILGGEWRKC